jgi:hypothetical protein
MKRRKRKNAKQEQDFIRRYIKYGLTKEKAKAYWTYLGRVTHV